MSVDTITNDATNNPEALSHLSESFLHRLYGGAVNLYDDIKNVPKNLTSVAGQALRVLDSPVGNADTYWDNYTEEGLSRTSGFNGKERLDINPMEKITELWAKIQQVDFAELERKNSEQFNNMIDTVARAIGGNEKDARKLFDAIMNTTTDGLDGLIKILNPRNHMDLYAKISVLTIIFSTLLAIEIQISNIGVRLAQAVDYNPDEYAVGHIEKPYPLKLNGKYPTNVYLRNSRGTAWLEVTPGDGEGGTIIDAHTAEGGLDEDIQITIYTRENEEINLVQAPTERGRIVFNGVAGKRYLVDVMNMSTHETSTVVSAQSELPPNCSNEDFVYVSGRYVPVEAEVTGVVPYERTSVMDYRVTGPGTYEGYLCPGNQTIKFVGNNIKPKEIDVIIPDDSDSVYNTMSPIDFDVMGDLNNDNKVTLEDVVLALEAVVNIKNENLVLSGDVNGDDRVGLQEAIYVLQQIRKSGVTKKQIMDDIASLEAPDKIKNKMKNLAESIFS